VGGADLLAAQPALGFHRFRSAMARLLKKKPASEKKKKPADDAQGVPVPAKEAAAVKRPSIFGGDSSKKVSAPVKKAADGTVKKSYIEQALQFLREVKVELKKVTWPSRKQTIGSTVVVIVLVMIISFFLGAVDIALSSLVGVILH
jgi:preprotein translocase subunit SecE